MAGNVSGLHTFTADVGPEALSLLDGNFSPLATGLNTLTNFSNYYVDVGSANALSFNIGASQTLPAYADGLLLEVEANFSTTSATPTVNVNGLGAKTITDNQGSPLYPGAIKAAGRYFLIYDGTNFRLLNPFAATVVTVFKSANTARTSTTPSNDPDLQIAILVAGTYLIEGIAWVWGTTTTTQGIQANLNYSGTFTVAASPSFSATAGIGASPTTNLIAIGSLGTLNAPGLAQFALNGSLTATGVGTLGFSWAQASASANATNVSGGSWLRLTRVA